jgi:hyperosmotically inducible protein
MNKRTSRLLLGSTLAAVAATALIGCNKAPDNSATTNAPTASTGTTMGTDVSDSAITASVKSALLADDVVKGLDVQVETRKGTVQLSGFVDSQAQIDQAVVLTRAVSGVNYVENGITLKGGAGGMGAQMDDTAVTGRVKTSACSPHKAPCSSPASSRTRRRSTRPPPSRARPRAPRR